MNSTQDYLEQLITDKQTLVDNINIMGGDALDTDTFTELAPKVLNIPTGSGQVDEVTTRLNDEDEIEVTGIYTTQDTARKIWEGTLAQYNALETKDNDTYYYITDDETNNLTHETWTFTLADDSVVTKEVVLWTSQM